MEDYKNKYENLLHDTDIAIAGQKEGETKIVLQNLKERHTESEDERVLKIIKKTLKSYNRGVILGSLSAIDYADCLAWLEKQGTKESKKTSIWHHWKDGIAGNGEGKLIYLIKNGNDYRLSSCLGYECDYILLSDLDKLMLQEKQGEQKSTDKVEPKSDIEKGKWYVCNTPLYRDFVLGKAYYCPKNGMLKPNENEMARYVARYCFHLWTIRDAKDGDVLATPLPKGYEAGEQIFIFKEINCRDYVSNCIEYYCRVCQGVFYENKIGFMGTTDEIFHPATKEQRDLLFTKMKWAGYQWDAEKKELKRIEQKPAWSEEVKRMFIKALERVEEQNNKGYKLTDCDKNSWWEDFKTYCGYAEMQKSAWNEEDEKGLGDTLWAIQQARTIAKDENDMGNLWYAENWLKSLKQRMKGE